MGRLDPAPPPVAIELPLPWGPVVRGVRWGDAPDTVLLLHDPGADLDAWGALPARLSQILVLQAVAVDLPGHGLSDDPWEPEKAVEVVRVLAETSLSRAPGAIARQFVVGAGDIASFALALAPPLGWAGLVLLSPTAVAQAMLDAANTTPPSPGSTGRAPSGRRGMGGKAAIPKLFFAGSLAAGELQTARRLASSSAGWTVVTSIPAAERGTRLLATPWRSRIEEEVVGFLRDCLRPRPRPHPGSRMPPPFPG